MKQVMTVRMEPEVVERLEQLAKATDRSKSYLVAEAIREYLALNAWQVEAIAEGVRQADAGQLVAHRDVRRKWEKKRGRKTVER